MNDALTMLRALAKIVGLMTKEELAAAVGLGQAASGHDTMDRITAAVGLGQAASGHDTMDRITAAQIEEIARSPWAFESAHISRALRQLAADNLRLQANAKPVLTEFLTHASLAAAVNLGQKTGGYDGE